MIIYVKKHYDFFSCFCDKSSQISSVNNTFLRLKNSFGVSHQMVYSSAKIKVKNPNSTQKSLASVSLDPNPKKLFLLRCVVNKKQISRSSSLFACCAFLRNAKQRETGVCVPLFPLDGYSSSAKRGLFALFPLQRRKGEEQPLSPKGAATPEQECATSSKGTNKPFIELGHKIKAQRGSMALQRARSSPKGKRGHRGGRQGGQVDKEKKEINKYYTSYSKLSEVKLLTIGIASPLRILQWAEKTLPNGKIYGEVLNANTLHHKTFKPQKGGLFCERIFGPLKDFECACGKIDKSSKQSQTFFTQESSKKISSFNSLPSPPLDGLSSPLGKSGLFALFPLDGRGRPSSPKGEEQPSSPKGEEQPSSPSDLSTLRSLTKGSPFSGQDHGGVLLQQGGSLLESSSLKGDSVSATLSKRAPLRKFCPDCDVEYTWSVIRRYQLGYIKLCSPVTHIWFLKGTPSYLSLLLDMKKRYLQFITYCSEILTIEKSSLPIYSVGNVLKSNSLGGLSSSNPSLISSAPSVRSSSLFPPPFSPDVLPLVDLRPFPREESNKQKKREEVSLSLQQRSKEQETKGVQYKKLLKKPLPKKGWYLNGMEDKNGGVKKGISIIPTLSLGVYGRFLIPKNFRSVLDYVKKESPREVVTSNNNLFKKLPNFKNLSKKTPIDLYILYLLEQMLQKSSLTLSIQNTWEYLHKQAFIKAINKIKLVWAPALTALLYLNRERFITEVKDQKPKFRMNSFAPARFSVARSFPSMATLPLDGLSSPSMAGGSLQSHRAPLGKRGLFAKPSSPKGEEQPSSPIRGRAQKGDERGQQQSKREKETKKVNEQVQQIEKNSKETQTTDLVLKNLKIKYTNHVFKLLENIRYPIVSLNNSTKFLQKNRFCWVLGQPSQIEKKISSLFFVYNTTEIEFYLLKNTTYISNFLTKYFLNSFILDLYLNMYINKTNKVKKKEESKEKKRREFLVPTYRKGTAVDFLRTNEVVTTNQSVLSQYEIFLKIESALAPGLAGAKKVKKSDNITALRKDKKGCFTRPTKSPNRLLEATPSYLGVKSLRAKQFSSSSLLPFGLLLLPFSLAFLLSRRDPLDGLSSPSMASHPPRWPGAAIEPLWGRAGSFQSHRAPRRPLFERPAYEAPLGKSGLFAKPSSPLIPFGEEQGAATPERSKQQKERREPRLNNSSSVTTEVTTRRFFRTSPLFEHTKNLYNNVYTLSHRERWDIEKDWQIFTLFTFGTTEYLDSPIYTYKNRLFSFINEEDYTAPRRPGSAYEAPSLLSSRSLQSHRGGSYAGKQRANPLRNDQSLQREAISQINNRFSFSSSFYSGAGIVQQLLNEFDFYEIKKLDKQNRLILYELNKYILKLKKQVQIFVYDKTAQIELKELCKKRDLLIRRTKLVRKLFRKNSNPASMILNLIPVLPPDLRPIVKMGSQIAASDLNRLYQRVIYRNDRLKKFLKDPATSQSYEMKYAQRLLQEAVDNLLQNGKSGPNSEKDARGRALKSLSDVLKGKQGRFRQFLLGKRVDYSGRSVIVVGPKLKLHECGLPLEMAKELYLPFLLKSILNKNYAKTVVGAKSLIKNNSSLAHELLREIMQVSPVLLNRAPTLHRLGIQAFVPKLIEGRAILLHPLVCSAFNADFDGDQMAVHVPITVEARAEAWKMMLSRNNILSTATGDPLAIPSQDMVLGCYYLTTFSNHGKILRGSGMYFNSLRDVIKVYEQRRIDVHSLIWVKWANFIENGTDQEDPLEIRLSSFGQWQEISSNYHRIYDSHHNLISQYICTTPGRILFNLIIQNITIH
jgi:DNA-directed RNA polymerase beta' subunit